MTLPGRTYIRKDLACKILLIIVVSGLTLIGVRNRLVREPEPVTLVTLSIIRWKPGDDDSDFNTIKNVCVNKNGDIGLVKRDAELPNGLPQGKVNSVVEVKQEDEIVFSSAEHVLHEAKGIGAKHKTVLISVINDGYIPFLYSWLCNTQQMGVQDSVLVITTDLQTVKILRRDWPDVHAVAVDLKVPPGNQGYSRVGYVKIMVKRAEILLDILKSGVNFMLTEFDYVWFGNPVPTFEALAGADILINPVSLTNGRISNGGLIYTFSTPKSIQLWNKLVEMMRGLGEKLESMPDNAKFSEYENDQEFFSQLIRERYADVQTHDLPLERYADGVWYMMSDTERAKTNPIMISNNFIEGNVNKMKRAKQWKHWFLRDDCTCDVDLVSRTVVQK